MHMGTSVSPARHQGAPQGRDPRAMGDTCFWKRVYQFSWEVATKMFCKKACKKASDVVRKS